jgi:hypothetical protein
MLEIFSGPLKKEFLIPPLVGPVHMLTLLLLLIILRWKYKWGEYTLYMAHLEILVQKIELLEDLLVVLLLQLVQSLWISL